MKKEIKDWGRALARSTVVDRMFGGVMVSTIVCKECQSTRHLFETFLDISLPIYSSESTKPLKHARQNGGILHFYCISV